MQMKMFLTRLCENSHMIVTGDPSQIDLPPGQTSGLAEAVALLGNVEGVEVCHFNAADVVRHELVGRIVAAYEGKAAPARARAEARANEAASQAVAAASAEAKVAAELEAPPR